MRRIYYFAMVGIGIACLAAASFNDWFTLPSSYFPLIATDTKSRPTLFQAPLQILSGVLAVVSFVALRFRRRYRWWLAVGQVGLLAGFLFPYLVTVWDSDRSLEARALYIQAQSLNHEVNENFPSVQAHWMRDLRLRPEPRVVDTLRSFSLPPGVVRLDRAGPITGTSFRYLTGTDVDPLQPALIDTYFCEIGYCDNFLRFLRRGHILLLLGSISLLFAACLCVQNKIRCLGVNLFCLACTWSIAMLVCLIPIFMALHFVDHADDLRAKGQYANASDALTRAARVLPALESKISFRRARGELYARLGRIDEPDYHFFAALVNDQIGHTATAMFLYRTSLEQDESRDPTLPIYVADVFVNEGIKYFNAGALVTAQMRWQEALRIHPTHLRAMNYLAILAILTSDFEGARRYSERFLELQDHFQRPFKPVLSRILLIIAWSHFRENNFKKAFEFIVMSNNV